jgi:catalase
VATTPKEALGKIDARFGAHARHRALHAKGVICKATFTATPEAATLTRAGHMTGETIPTTVRISNGGGDPTVPDYAPDVRGLATAFHLPDGTRTDILAQTLPRFPFRDQEGFLDVLAISKPSISALLKFPRFAFKYPKAVAQLPETNRILNSRASFASRRYFPFHAFKWIDADGGERYVRYAWLQTIDEPDISKSEAKRRGPNYLFDDLEERLGREPVRWDLAVEIAGDGDDPDDPSSVWPEGRERVIVGRLEVTAIDPDADDGIVMDPVRLVDGIEPSGDPALLYRPPVYDLSHARRTAQ